MMTCLCLFLLTCSPTGEGRLWGSWALLISFWGICVCVLVCRCRSVACFLGLLLSIFLWYVWRETGHDDCKVYGEEQVFEIFNGNFEKRQQS